MQQISKEEANVNEAELQIQDTIIENYDEHFLKPLIADIQILDNELIEQEKKVYKSLYSLFLCFYLINYIYLGK